METHSVFMLQIVHSSTTTALTSPSPCNCPLRVSHVQSGWSCFWVEGLGWRTPLSGICTSFHELMHYIHYGNGEQLAHAGQVFVHLHVHTCRLKGVATTGIIMPEIISILDICTCETRDAAYSEWYKSLMVTLHISKPTGIGLTDNI